MIKAYTLIETVIMLAIMMTIAGITITITTDYASDTLKKDLFLLDLTIQRLTQEAISSNTKKYLYLDPKNNRFFYKKGEKPYIFNLHKENFFGFLPSIKGPPSNPKSLIKSYTTFDQEGDCNVITLYPDGSSSAGSVYLICPKKQKICALTCSVSQVLWNRRYLYHNATWTLIGYQYDEK